jgi:hypothetical protein
LWIYYFELAAVKNCFLAVNQIIFEFIDFLF